MIVSDQTASTLVNPATVVFKDDSSSVVVPAALQLRSMEAGRINWEQGAYRTSNQALYSVLAECLAYSGQLDLTLSKLRLVELMNFYKERGYYYNEDTPLVSRVVRAVFGNVDRRRISTYSLVLRQAQKENVAYANLSNWIEAHGGIQEIRLSRSSSFVNASTKANVGKQYFESKDELAIVNSESLSVNSSPDFIGQACLLLAEQVANGSFYVRSVIRNKAALNAAYVALYVAEKEAVAKSKKEVKAANDADGAVAQQA